MDGYSKRGGEKVIISLDSWIVALSTWKDICDQSRVQKYSFIQDALLDYDIES